MPEEVLFGSISLLGLREQVEEGLCSEEISVLWSSDVVPMDLPPGRLSALVMDVRESPTDDLRSLLSIMTERHIGLAVLLVGCSPNSAGLLGGGLMGPIESLDASESQAVDLIGDRIRDLCKRRRTFLDSVRDLREELEVCEPELCGRILKLREELTTKSERLQAAEQELRHSPPTTRLIRLSNAAADGGPFGEILGVSQVIQVLRSQLARASHSDCNVLLIGETGTGKDLAAAALHRASSREGSFVVVNCAAMPEALLESELFGHVRGAFTGATTDRPGLLQEARGGTLFLDEIGDMPLPLQGKLLRVLQNRVMRPVGSDREVPVDVRLIAATHCNLAAAIREGTFRGDLYYRINVIQIDVPPLRRRGQDVLLLANSFLQQCAAEQGRDVRAITPAAAERLAAYDWPGNVRELLNCMDRAVAMTDHECVQVEDLTRNVRAFRDVSGLLEPTTKAPLPELATLAEIERAYVLRVLDRVDGNKTEGARVLGIARKTLYRKLQQMQVRSRKSAEQLPLAGGPDS